MKCPQVGKHMHEDEIAAKRHIASLRRQGGGWDMVAYPCDHCKTWHVGHNNEHFVKRIRRATRRRTRKPPKGNR